jgi:hypothetical protein
MSLLESTSVALQDDRMLIHAATLLDQLVTLTAPAAQVAPVVESLASVASTIRAELPALEQARTSAAMLDDLQRIANSAGQLHDSLDELMRVDGMQTFDPAFAADDAAWDDWFTRSAEIVRAAAAGQPITSTASV